MSAETRIDRKVRLDHLLGVYAVGSGDWPWREEYDNLIDQPGTQKLLARIRDEGIREPILLGTDGRVWDGHHRIIIAMHLGLDSVPVEFAGEDGALTALIAEKQAEARRDVILRDVRKAVVMALAFVPWPRAGEEYDAGLMVDALTKEFVEAQRLREQATNQVSRGE